MGNSTKERILEEALEEFAQNGYNGTNLRDLASRLGLSKSALYKHYESKEAIWNAVFEMMESYYTEHFGSSDNLPPIPRSCDELFALTMRMIRFTTSDRRIILTRRILLTEQFRDERARKSATLHFLTDTKEIFTKIFAAMAEQGLIRGGEPEMLAFAYTAPITALIHLCDREPDKAAEITSQAEAFIRHFISVYSA